MLAEIHILPLILVLVGWLYTASQITCAYCLWCKAALERISNYLGLIAYLTIYTTYNALLPSEINPAVRI